MCQFRMLGNERIPEIYFISRDRIGAKVEFYMKHLPHAWEQLAQGKSFSQAICSPAIKGIAWDIFLITHQKANRVLNSRYK